MPVLLVLLVFGHRLTQFSHPVAQGFHRFGLLINRVGQIILTQRVFRPAHGFFGALQRFPRGITAFGSRTRQVLALAFQLLPQGLLAIRKAFLRRPSIGVLITLPFTLLIALA